MFCQINLACYILKFGNCQFKLSLFKYGGIEL